MKRPLVLASLLLVAAAVGGGASERICPGSIPDFPINDHGMIRAVAAVDDLVVTFDQRGITTWSLVNPEEPVQLGGYEITREHLSDWNHLVNDEPNVGLYLNPSGEWACITPSFECFDVRDPSRPMPFRWALDEWPCSSSYDHCSHKSGVAFRDDMLAVVRNRTEIWLLDLGLANPAAWIRPENWADRFEYIQSVTFAGEVLLVLESDKTLTAWDLEDPAQPVEIARTTINTTSPSASRWTLRGHRRGAVAIGSDYWPREIVAISTTHLPQLLSVELTDELDWNVVQDMRFVGDAGAAIMATWDWDADEIVWHIAELRVATPFVLLRTAMTEIDSPLLAVTDRHAIGAPRLTRLSVFGLGGQLPRVSETPMMGEALDLAVDGNLGVVANGAGGIAVLDLSSPANPVVVARKDLDTDYVELVELSGETALVIAGTTLRSFDLSNPSSPRQLDSLELNAWIHHLEINDEIAVMATGYECDAFFVDFSDPASLDLRSVLPNCESHPYSDMTLDLDLVGSSAYFVRDYFLQHLDFSDPDNPIEVQTIDDRRYDRIQPIPGAFLGVDWGGFLNLFQMSTEHGLSVGRVYTEISGYTISRAGSSLYSIRTNEKDLLVDFADLIEPRIYDVPMLDGYQESMGTIVDSIWVRPFEHELDLVSLECRPPEAAFRWAGADLTIWFEDTTRYRVEERLWDFGDGTTSSDAAPVHSYAEPGRYRVSLAVQGTQGSDTVTRSINVLEPRLRKVPPPSSAVD